MEVEITGRHFEVTDTLEKHVRQHIDKLTRFDNRIHSLTVTLAVESATKKAELVANCHHSVLVAEAEAHDMYDAIVQAFAKMEHQITRLHDKLTTGKARARQRASKRKREEAP